MASPAQPPASQEELLQKLKDDPEAWNEWWMGLGPANRAQMSLQHADLSNANLQDRKLCDANLKHADLRGADLRRADLSGARLGLAKMNRVLLGHANLAGAKLYRASLHRANLQDVNFKDADLLRTDLRETNLRGADLSNAKAGLLSRQVAGADLTGARLPEPITKLYEKLGSASEISDSAKKLFLTLLAACLYSWLTIATTKDVDLITNRASSPLPIIQTTIPIIGFYVVAPIILLCIYFYFHFYLQKLWEELAHFPAVFPDGKPLYQRADPWLFNDLVRAHFAKLKRNRPFLSKFQSGISILLAWWLVPITLLLFWGRYLPRHDAFWTVVLALILSLSIASAFQLYRLAKETLQGQRRATFSWSKTLKQRRIYGDLVRVLAVTSTLIALSIGAIFGKPWNSSAHASPRTWVPGAMHLLHYSSFANLAEANAPNANLSGRNLCYMLADRSNLAGAQLDDANLDGAHLDWASFSFAYMDGASLRFAYLRNALLKRTNLTRADFEGAYLESADFDEANLTQANLHHTWLSNSNLANANIQYADLRDAAGLTFENVSSAKNYSQAFLPKALILALHLPLDHNEALQAYRDSKSQEPFGDAWIQKWRASKAKTDSKLK